MAKISTILFDCDNTLVLSESLAFTACANLANRILAANSIADRYTGPQLLAEFVGQNFRGMITSLAGKYDLIISDDKLEAYVAAEEEEVISTLKLALVPCVGVMPVLEHLQSVGTYKLSVVSSSALRRIQVSLEKVGMDRFFAPDSVFSAATSLPTPTTKPDPAVYLWAVEKLGVTTTQCVAVEDSRSGATSACRAGIKTVGYTGSYEDDEVDKMTQVLKDSGAVVIMKNWDEFEGILEKIQKGEL